jgi:hypothetical protein
MRSSTCEGTLANLVSGGTVIRATIGIVTVTGVGGRGEDE